MMTNQHKARYALAFFNGLLILGVSGYYFGVIRPWIIPPQVSDDTVEAQWQQIEGWARVDTPQDGVVLNQVWDSAPREWLNLDAADRPDPVPMSQALAAWSPALGIGPVCADRDVRHGITLTQALLDSPAAEDELPKLLALSQALRRQGDYGDAILGLSMANLCREWALEHGLEHGAFETYRPTSEEVFGALARDAVCGRAQIDALTELNLPDPRNASFAWRPYGTDLFLSLEREQQWFRAYNAERIVLAYEARHNMAALQVAYPETPKSVLVRVWLLHVRDDYVSMIADYDDWVN